MTGMAVATIDWSRANICGFPERSVSTTAYMTDATTELYTIDALHNSSADFAPNTSVSRKDIHANRKPTYENGEHHGDED